MSPSIYFSYQKQTVQIFEMFEIKFFDPVPLKCRKESWKKILKGLKSVFILLSNFSCSELLACFKNLEIQSKLWRDDVWKFNVYLNSEYFCQRRRQVHLMRWWWNDANVWWSDDNQMNDHNNLDVHHKAVCVCCVVHIPLYIDDLGDLEYCVCSHIVLKIIAYFLNTDPWTFPLSWYF